MKLFAVVVLSCQQRLELVGVAQRWVLELPVGAAVLKSPRQNAVDDLCSTAFTGKMQRFAPVALEFQSADVVRLNTSGRETRSF